MNGLTNLILGLPGPILVIGASGFVGCNLLKVLLRERDDVIGTFFSGDSWRLEGIHSRNISFFNMQDAINVRTLLMRIKPEVIFDCSSFGAYSFEEDFERIYETNFTSFIHIMEIVSSLGLSAYIHAGSSSEYGKNAAGPAEDGSLIPNSHYAVSKAAASNAIAYYGKVRGVPVVNLRLYSIYGPYEDSSRLIPVVCEHSLRGKLPLLARTEVERDFVYVDDAVEAFLRAAMAMSSEIAGESFNIGTGIRTSLADLANIAKKIFEIKEEPRFNRSAGRAWDEDIWFARPQKANQLLGWKPSVQLADGLLRTRDWWSEYLHRVSFDRLSKKQHTRREKKSVSVVIACYRDAEAIPIMHKRLVAVFEKLKIDYEIIFVNDGSPDFSTECIREISAADPNVIGITHSRNFGSQAAFRSGMEMARKESCVLMDGDLQDPPELIEEFINRWREGADVVFGCRVKREMPLWLELFYKGFYRMFAAMSEVNIPKDAGDFSLLDRLVVHWVLQCSERDSFLRGLRAYVGFSQVGVDYVRPERMFGRSTNNWIKNIGWAKKAIFSFSRMPLHLMTACGVISFIFTILLALTSLAIRLLQPESVPKGMTFLALLIMFFGSASLLGLGLLGEYLGKVLEETKSRPPFIRKNIILRGKVEPADAFLQPMELRGKDRRTVV